MDIIKTQANVILPELSYEIVGVCYGICNQIGPGQKEKIYQNAVALALKKREIPFSEQVYCPIRCDGQIVGKYFLDFLVDEKIVLELKVASRFKQADYFQVKEYLRIQNKPLGILARFDQGSVIFNRILKPN